MSATCISMPATVCPSLAEGFYFSGVEAMRSGGAVLASDIPVHREMYADAAEYFNPYCVESLLGAMKRVLSDTEGTALQQRLREQVSASIFV